ncbi:hypothetical protein C2845_PM01G08950 [Panicum miliaceum]|uniref:Uncharacterized protein n=1 Tax=Panicum miliaceum TaxID=4540 RepID=A0A3L6TQ44_PANMI|nr:hypothetical protein C2845_PM01G08950 [Panicum miliaceum]
MCPLHYCHPFFNFRDERREFWFLATLFIKSTHPHLMSKEPAAGERRGEERSPERKKETKRPNPTQDQNTPVPSPGRPSATICSHGDGLQDGDGGDEREGGVPALVHGDEVEEGAPLRGVQDRRAVARRAGGQGGRPRRGVRGARRRAARRRLPLRRL